VHYAKCFTYQIPVKVVVFIVFFIHIFVSHKLIINIMRTQVRGVSVLSTAEMGASGDLVTNILIGSKFSRNQGLVRIAGLPPFQFKNVHRYSGLQPYTAAVAGVYTFDPASGATDATTNVELRFSITGFPNDAPQPMRQFNGVIVTVGATETLTNAQLCQRIVDAFAGNKYYTAAVSGSGASSVVTFTEKFLQTPLVKQPAITTLHLSGQTSVMTFSKTTATVAQIGFTGTELNAYVNGEYEREGSMKEFDVVNKSLISTGTNYDVIEIIFNKRSVTAPFGFAGNEPYVYKLFVPTNATNKAVFLTKLNALFAADSTVFVNVGDTNGGVSYVTTDTGDVFSHSTNANLLPGNGEPIVFSTITSTTGISTNTVYYVVNKTATTFQVATVPGGSAIALTTNGSAVSALWLGDATVDALLATPIMTTDLDL
jgi:hypothetical protein